MNGHLRDAVPDHCVHGFSQRAERWFVETVEVQLRFSRCYWIDGEVRLHKRKKAWHPRGFPFELQPSGRPRHDFAILHFDVLDRNSNIGFDPDPSDIDPQFGRNRLNAGSRGLRGRLKHRWSVLAQRVADLFIGMVDVVVAVNFASFTHQSRSFRICRG